MHSMCVECCVQCNGASLPGERKCSWAQQRLLQSKPLTCVCGIAKLKFNGRMLLQLLRSYLHLYVLVRQCSVQRSLQGVLGRFYHFQYFITRNPLICYTCCALYCHGAAIQRYTRNYIVYKPHCKAFQARYNG